MADVTVTGDAAIKRKLEQLAKQYPGATGAALYQEGFDLLNKAVKRTPIARGGGTLRTSGYVAPPTQSGGYTVVEVGYGTKYAAYQHEGLNFRHPTGGEAEYLRKAINEARPGFLDRLAKRIQRNVESGVTAPAIAAPQRPGTEAAVRKKPSSSSRVKRASKRRP